MDTILTLESGAWTGSRVLSTRKWCARKYAGASLDVAFQDSEQHKTHPLKLPKWHPLLVM